MIEIIIQKIKIYLTNKIQKNKNNNINGIIVWIKKTEKKLNLLLGNPFLLD